MNVFAELAGRIRGALEGLAAAGALSRLPDLSSVTVETPRDPGHGDLATRAALAIARELGLDPREMAQALVAALSNDPDIASARVAGPGFVNLTMTDAYWRGALARILATGTSYGRSAVGNGAEIRIDCTLDTPLSLRDARLAILCDANANLLEAAGFAVRRSFHGRFAPQAMRADLARLGIEGALGSSEPAFSTPSGVVGPVDLLRGGQPVKMSERAGEALSDALDAIGADALRFAVLLRRSDARLDLDLAEAVDRSKANPVFLVQYAHARACSLERRAPFAVPELRAEAGPTALALARLDAPAELALIRRIAGFPDVVERAAAAREPHRLAGYLHDVSSDFHALWGFGKDQPHLRFINDDDRQSTAAHLALVLGTQLVLRNGLGILRVSAPDEML